MKEKRNLLNLLILVVLLIAIPLLIMLVQQRQILRSRATGNTGEIQFTGSNIIPNTNGAKFKLDQNGQPKVGLQLTSPIGPPASASPIASPNP